MLVWGCPVPGAILYTFVNPMMESPEHARERLNQPPSLGISVEATLALGFAGAAGLAVVPEAIPAATIASYDALIAALARAALLAGQAVPKIVGAAGAAAAPALAK